MGWYADVDEFASVSFFGGLVLTELAVLDIAHDAVSLHGVSLDHISRFLLFV